MSELMIPNRRVLLSGLCALIASPAIVRASSLMGIKALPDPYIGIDLASRPDSTAILTFKRMQPFTVGDIITFEGDLRLWKVRWITENEFKQQYAK